MYSQEFDAYGKPEENNPEFPLSHMTTPELKDHYEELLEAAEEFPNPMMLFFAYWGMVIGFCIASVGLLVDAIMMRVMSEYSAWWLMPLWIIAGILVLNALIFGLGEYYSSKHDYRIMRKAKNELDQRENPGAERKKKLAQWDTLSQDEKIKRNQEYEESLKS